MIKKLRSDIDGCIRRRLKYCHKASPLAMMYYIIIIHPFQSVVKKHSFYLQIFCKTESKALSSMFIFYYRLDPLSTKLCKRAHISNPVSNISKKTRKWRLVRGCHGVWIMPHFCIKNKG